MSLAIDIIPAFFHDIVGMDDTSLTRVYLESLSTDELLKLADKFGIDIPFELERVFIIEELLSIGIEEEDETEAVQELHSGFPEAAALPKQYNISFIEVIIRDPFWAFVFWELKNNDREIYEKAADFGGYCLRVFPVTTPKTLSGAADIFTVHVGPGETARYLGFPPAEGSYRVELCVIRGTDFVPLIVSRPFRLPRLLEPVKLNADLSDDLRKVYDNPLACMSGAKDFPIIRSADRNLRVKENNTISMQEGKII